MRCFFCYLVIILYFCPLIYKDMKTTALYKYLFIVLFFGVRLVLAQQGVEALFIKEGVLLKCEDLSNVFDIAAPSLPPLSRLTSNFKFLHRCVRVSKVVHMDHKEWLKVATDGA